jgi:AraC-like DNA-binding protein
MADWVAELFVSATTARWDSLRGSASAALLVDYGVELGLTRARCLAATGIAVDQLEDPESEISARQELAVVENLVTVLGDQPGVGLGAGLRYGLQTYGIFGFAVLSSSTLREAIAVGERFRELAYALVDVHSELVDGEVRIVLDAAETPPACRRFAVERDAAAIALLQRELFAEPAPFRRVAFTDPAPGRSWVLHHFEQALGVTPEFGATQNMLVVDAALLDRPLPRASEFAAAQCQAQCQVLIDRRHQRSGLAGQVRSQLLADPARMADQQQVADALHMAVRTLRRRLEAEGTSFRAIVSETKVLLAQELLATGQLTIDQVADRLGYSEASSFVHAFTRWSGVSPGRWTRRTLAP